MATLRENATGLIPVELSKDIVSEVSQSSAVMALSRIEPMTTGKKTISVSNGSDAFWVSEGQVIGEKDTGFRPVELVTEKLAIIHVFSKELINESIADVFEAIKRDIVTNFQIEFDREAISGDKKQFDTSISKVINESGHSVIEGTNDLYIDDLSDSMALVEDGGLEVNGFIGHNGMKNKLRKLRDANGYPLYQPTTEGAGNILYGEPVEFTRGLNKNTTDLIVGDFEHSVVGIKGDIEYELLTEATVNGGINLAVSDLVAIKATMHVAYAITNDEAFAALKADTPTSD